VATAAGDDPLLCEDVDKAYVLEKQVAGPSRASAAETQPSGYQ